ncbi:DNA repair protein rhp57 [Linderina pennispora]|nr:DNA repair protein rhp57 [Linderina pennispora]
MAAAYVKEYADRVDAGGFLNNISVAEFEDWETMGHAIRYKVPALLSHGQVRLVIIDSIAAHLRFDTEQDSSSRTAGEFYKQRSGFLIEAGQMFRSWASEYNCAVVCVNQVKDVFDQPQSQPRLLSDVSDMSVVPQTAKELCYKDFAALGMNSKAPALGNLWANAIDARITLYYRRGLSQAEARATEQEGELVEVPNELLRTRRWLELSFAPWCSRRTCEIALDDRGFYSFGINSHEIDEVGGVF